MTTTELIAFLKSPDFKTVDQAFHLLMSDMDEVLTDAEQLASERAIQYFAYKISVILLPVIQELRRIAVAGCSPVHEGE